MRTVVRRSVYQTNSFLTKSTTELLILVRVWSGTLVAEKALQVTLENISFLLQWMEELLAMSKLFTVLLLLTLSVASFAQGKRAEVFLGYSNLQADRSFDSFGTGNINNFRDTFKRNSIHGGEASITGFPVAWLGLTGDFSYHQKSSSSTTAAGVNNYDRKIIYFMGGPTLKIRNPTRVEPYVHALFGGAHVREEFTLTPTGTTGTIVNFKPSDTHFALGLGGGLDVRLGDKFSLRLIQVDYTPIFTGDRVFNVNNTSIRLDKNRVDNLRLSVGVVF